MKSFDRKIFMVFFTVVISLLFVWMSCTLLFSVVFKRVLLDEGIDLDSRTKFESIVKDGFPYSDFCKNIKGLVYILLNKNAVDNFSYVKDSHGVVRIVSKENGSLSIGHSLSKLNDVLVKIKKDYIPVVYVNLPNSQKYLDYHLKKVEGGEVEKILDDIRKNSAVTNILDLDKFDIPKDFYFKTDLHFSTEGELFVLEKILDYLSESHLKNISSVNIYDESLFYKEQYAFIGNTSRSAGRFFTNKDVFSIYIPKYPTSFRLEIPDRGIDKRGDFKNVVLNGMSREQLLNVYSYKVINFGHFTERLYTYKNLSSKNGTKVLIICDSVFMRGFSYLSLFVEEVTVFDPRFNHDQNYLSKLVTENNYDAIIVVGISGTFFRSPF